MKRSTFFSSFVLSTALLIGTAQPSPALAGERGDASLSDQRWLSIPQVHDKLEAAGYRNVEKIEREHGGYEVRATDRSGTRVKLTVNPQTGEIADRPTGGKRTKPARDQRAGQGAECNQRRCRDDLPATPASR
jgi:hypothetical protein